MTVTTFDDPTESDDWWQAVFSQQEHDELVAMSEEVINGYHQYDDPIEITVLLDGDTFHDDWAEMFELVGDTDWGDMLIQAMADEYMSNPFIDADPESNRLFRRAKHLDELADDDDSEAEDDDL